MTVIKKIRGFLPHLLMAASFCFVVFFFIDRVNEAMGFFTSSFSHKFFLAVAVLALLSCIFLFMSKKGIIAGVVQLIYSLFIICADIYDMTHKDALLFSKTGFKLAILFFALTVIVIAIGSIHINRRDIRELLTASQDEQDESDDEISDDENTDENNSDNDDDDEDF